MTKQFVANLGSVAAETFDGEMVVINFEKGTYFSLSGSAPVIWEVLKTPRTIDELVRGFVSATPEKASDIRASIEAMINTLVQEDCIRQLQNENGLLSEKTYPVVETKTFIEPHVKIFHDLKDLIAIDPVHEADEFEGWPHRPPPVKLD